MFRGLVIYAVLLTCAFARYAPAQTFHLIKSLSGPSGKTVGSTFVFDEVRNRFVFPQDHSFIVYFEWLASAGEHVLIATWKGPDGRPMSISPDVKILSTGAQMNAYWTFEITPQTPSGIWSCEISMDGEPAGSHSFELVVPPQAKPQPAPAVHPPIDEIYKQALHSLVWVYADDADGTRLDTSSGFVIGDGRIATSFDAIDSATMLEIEFSNGRRIKTDEVLACSRLQNWAVLSGDTRETPALKPEGTAKVGDQILVFNAARDHSRTFGPAYVTSTQSPTASLTRILLDAQLSPSSSGGPVLDRDGKLIAMLVAGRAPASRFHERYSSVAPSLWSGFADVAAVPISILSSDAGATTLAQLAKNRVFTRPLSPGLSLLWGGTTDQAIKAGTEAGPRYTSEFRRNQSVWVEMLWQKREKTGKGFLSAQIFNAENRALITIEPKKFRLNESSPTRITLNFPVASLNPGVYRIDVLWNDATVWRTFFNVLE